MKTLLAAVIASAVSFGALAQTTQGASTSAPMAAKSADTATKPMAAETTAKKKTAAHKATKKHAAKKTMKKAAPAA
jgi:hypothetical protein